MAGLIRELLPLYAVYMHLHVSTGITSAAAEYSRPFRPGFPLLALGLLLITSGLTFMRLNGAGAWWPWALVAAGILVFVPFARFELRQADPLVDIRMLRGTSMWPVLLTAGLFGVSVLGAQAPLSTFARTDPALHGYGLGLRAGQVSIIIGVYVLALLVGALLYPVVTRRLTPRWTLVGAAALVGLGYLLFLPFHGSLAEALANMARSPASVPGPWWRRCPRRRRLRRPSTAPPSPCSVTSWPKQAPCLAIPARPRRPSPVTSRCGPSAE